MGAASMRTGGQVVAAALKAHGADFVFCVPGESYLPLLDALYDLKHAVSVVTCRHEQGAATMAEAYGKLTGRPGVCAVTRGPGACNASIAVHTAFQDSTPMLALVGQVQRRFLGREAFQEVDFVEMFRPLAKKAIQIDSVETLSRGFAAAWRLAVSGRPGPVVLAIPEDVLAETTAAAEALPAPVEMTAPDEELMYRLHRVLGDAVSPIMIVGGGGWTDAARADIVAFAEQNNLPTCCAFRRHDIFNNAHPAFVGELGIAADPALLARVADADVVLAVGTRLGEIATQFYTLLAGNRGARSLVHVHPDPAQIGRVFRADLAIPSAVGPFAKAARSLAPVGGERWRQWAADARADYVTHQTPAPCQGSLDLAAVMSELDRQLPADAIVTVDAGNFSGWPQRFLHFGGGRRLLGPTNGAMGYAVPAAVAAKIAMPEKVAVACVGDGGFGMTGQELATAVRYGADPVILVFNNGMYGTIRMHQERRYPERVIATGLTNPDFAALARAYGAWGETVTDTAAFGAALAGARAAGTAALIELRMDPDVMTTGATLSAIRRAAAHRRERED